MSVRSSLRLGQSVSVALMLACGCGAPDYDDQSWFDEGASVAEESQPLFLGGGAQLWPIAFGTWRIIPVCFIWSGDYVISEENRQRKLVKDALMSSWGRWTHIMFTGFGECASPVPNSTMAIKLTNFIYGEARSQSGDMPDQHPNAFDRFLVYGQGSTYTGARGWQGADQPTFGWMALNGASDAHAMSIVVHEVGHNLGLEHEQSRPDAVATCPMGDSLIPGTTYGPYDDIAAMSYCKPVEFARLSRQDIVNIRSLYGAGTAYRWLDAQAAIGHMVAY